MMLAQLQTVQGLSRLTFNVTLVGLCLAIAVFSFPANSIDLDTCAPGMPEWLLTTKIVYCLQTTVIAAVVAFMQLLTQILVPTYIALFTLAIIAFGIRILTGEKRIVAVGSGFLMRLGIVMFFTFYMPDIATLPFSILGELLSMVTGGWSPWVQIDLAVGRVMGFGPAISLFQGLLGIISAALYSTAVGAFTFLFGIYMVLQVLLLMYRAVYSYLVAMVLLGFIMVISPMIVPMAIFGKTERYAKKWFDLMVATLIHPMLLFAFLWMFLGVVDLHIGNIFNMLGGNDFSRYWRLNSPFFSWVMANDYGMYNEIRQFAPDQGGSAPLIQSFVNPLIGGGMDMAIVNHPEVDFGPYNMLVLQTLIMQFLSMTIIIQVIKTVMEHIPHLADDIAGVYTGMQFERLQFMDTVKRAVQQASAG